VTQIGNAGAANPSEALQGRHVGRLPEHGVDPVPAALERRAVMRGAEKDDLAQRLRPRVTRARGHIERTARDQATHAVRQDDEFPERHRPGSDEGFERIGECTTVGRNVQPGVVVQIDGRVAEVLRQRGPVVMAVARPLQIVHAEAMHEHEQLRARVRHRGGESRAAGRERLAFTAYAHRDRERVFRRGQVVAEHTVHHGHQAFARRRRLHLLERGGHRAQREVEAAAHRARDATDALVNQPGDAIHRATDDRAAQLRRRARDVGVNRLDQPGEARRGVDRQTACAAKIRDVIALRLAHG